MRKFFKGATVYILIFLAILLAVSFFKQPVKQVKEMPISNLVAAVQADQVANMVLQSNAIEGELKDGSLFTSYIPGSLEQAFGQEIYQKIVDQKILVDGKAPATRPFIYDLLPILLIVILFVVFWFMFMQNTQGGGNKVMSFGKSRARLNKDDEQKKITFADVAGLKEEKEEMQEVVDFLKSPKKYIDLGARVPKGILMVGPPGTGKTYLTRAVAGEAGVPFFSISGSDFVEMFVGVGASRVRDMFETAKKNSPCIVFIDEIDAVGRKRGAGLGGGHDEREQTLNQLLVEMDGFSENEGIIIIAATNRPDILDPALLRPGRFDRQVAIGVPDVAEREQMLNVHAKNKPIATDVDFKIIARGTTGFTPADLENVMNEAAILTARKNAKQITMPTIEEAIMKVIMGVEKKTRVVSEKERRLTAYHEAGHAVLAKILPETEPVHHVTIIPRGRAGGFVLRLPEDDRSGRTKSQFEKDIVISLGGRVAEKLILHDVSTGASSDLRNVTNIARAMVTKYAMSENLSAMSYAGEEEVFIGRDMAQMKHFSEQVQAELDREVRRIVDDAYETALSLLEQNLDKLHAVAEALLEFETINGDEFNAAFENGAEGVRLFRETHKDRATTTMFTGFTAIVGDETQATTKSEEAQVAVDVDAKATQAEESDQTSV